MNDARPLLQIIHVSDLHVCKAHNDKAAIAQLKRLKWLRQTSRELADSTKVWREGSAGHLESSERAFDRYLQHLVRTDKIWFPDGGDTAPATWLVDTGDASAFGDETSIQHALAKHAYWRGLLRNCQSRCLFGNHDLWPDSHPLFYLLDEDAELRAHMKAAFLERQALWDRRSWLEPLTVSVPGGPAIEFYALDSNGTRTMDEILAVGAIDLAELDSLREAIARRAATPTFRILGTHHPVTFPYTWDQKHVLFLKTMVLDNASAVLKKLRNDAGEDQRLAAQPYIHLFLSGHTHLGYPGEALLDDVAECHQEHLGRDQLQLVTGPLMQARSAERVQAKLDRRQLKGRARDYAQSEFFDANSQFQVLRFYYRDSRPGVLEMQREVWARTPLGKEYLLIDEFSSMTFVRY